MLQGEAGKRGQRAAVRPWANVTGDKNLPSSPTALVDGVFFFLLFLLIRGIEQFSQHPAD